MTAPEDRFDKLGTVAAIRPTHSGLKIQSSAEFVSGFVPPDYVLDGILQRGFLYSLTAPTGTGKTAVGLRVMAHVALGRSLAGRDVQKGPVAMLAGENADDVRMRWVGLSEHMGFAPSEMDAHFVPAVFDVSEALPALHEMADRIGGLTLVLVDTSAAYFRGDDENSNRELGDHARMLRSLTSLRGNPCIVANCHPTKNAQADNLLPRGGGAFIAEVDGNLTCAQREGAVELHWQGKFRGPDFTPLAFEMVRHESDSLKDTRGRRVPTVVARPLTDLEQSDKASAANADLHQMLRVMAANPGASISALAEAADWRFAGGNPAKSRVSRRLKELQDAKLAAKELGTWTLTPKGQAAAKRLPE